MLLYELLAVTITRIIGIDNKLSPGYDNVYKLIILFAESTQPTPDSKWLVTVVRHVTPFSDLLTLKFTFL